MIDNVDVVKELAVKIPEFMVSCVPLSIDEAKQLHFLLNKVLISLERNEIAPEYYQDALKLIKSSPFLDICLWKW